MSSVLTLSVAEVSGIIAAAVMIGGSLSAYLSLFSFFIIFFYFILFYFYFGIIF